MRRFLPVLLLLAAAVGRTDAKGLVIPVEKKVPPLAMVHHQANIVIEDQVAVTHLEQTFRNHTSQNLEATYVFPVPRGASVSKFSMVVDGKEIPGEIIEAAQARKIYTDIVQRTLDPGLLEYLGNNLLQFKVFPVPAKKDLKVKIKFTSVAAADNGIIEYVYPLKTDGKSAATLEKFGITVELKSQHPIQNIYSPTHAVTITRSNDRNAKVVFEKNQAILDRDFQLYYTAGGKDVGITALTHRPFSIGNGYFMMLISPRAELAKEQQVPRDFVFVLDTSGSMRGQRMTQARNALKYCLSNLTAKDRFTVINFATTVNRYADKLQPAGSEDIAQARKWVDQLEATGGTAINDALLAALDLRPREEGRTFSIVFFTDGRPTIGETNVNTIQKNVLARNNANTRIFTFGVGDDVNATFLDALAEESRAVSTFVRETEDIEVKVSSLYGKISNPVLTDLKLTVGKGVTISEVYPPQLPDLFHGNQLVVLGRYTGTGHVAVTLSGKVGKDTRDYVYELSFPEKTAEKKDFVEDLWARRKVGYLLDQIRVNGEKKELVEEVVTLAKKYGITTPYTSYLIVPDAPVPVVNTAPKGKKGDKDGKPDVSFGVSTTFAPPQALQQGPGKTQIPVTDFLKQTTAAPPTPNMGGQGFGGYGNFGQLRFDQAGKELAKIPVGDAKSDPQMMALQKAKDSWYSNQYANQALKKGNLGEVQNGKLGVDLSCENTYLRNQTQLSQSAVRRVGLTNCLEVGGVWVDEAFDPKMKVVAVKAMSPAYFKLLERHPQVKGVFQLGNHLVWVTPSGTALAIDTTAGAEKMSDADLDALFVAPAKKK